jgi:archaellum component FlaC
MNTSDDNTLSPVTLTAIMDTLSSLGEKMDNNFRKLREEMENFKQDLKTEVQVLRNTVSELEMASQMSSSKIKSVEVSNKSLSLSLASQVKEIDTLRAQLNKEKEKKFYIWRSTCEEKT